MQRVRARRESLLCEDCGDLDIAWLSLGTVPHPGYFAGITKDIFDRSWRCSFCYLLTKAIRKIWLLDRKPYAGVATRKKKPSSALLSSACYIMPVERVVSLTLATWEQDDSTRVQDGYQAVLNAHRPVWPHEGRMRNLRVVTDPNPWEYDIIAPETPSYVKEMSCNMSSRSRSYEFHCLYNHPKASELSVNHRQFAGRLIDVYKADLALARQWLSECPSLHGSVCEQPETSTQMLLPMRLIEVTSRQLVQVDTPCRYVILSYVWGGIKVGTEWQYGSEGLEGSRGYFTLPRTLPATIEDAITVTKELGERYLWVDQLCILQDDPADKHNVIASMDRIYADSILTIVAAAGCDANAGLIGVGGKSRSEPQACSIIDGFVVCQKLSGYSNIIKESVWQSRAWTYQESMLSRRLLVFGHSQMFFKCKQTVWFEDTVAEPTLDIAVLEKPATQHQIMPLRPFSELPAWTAYRRLLHEYSRRTLSYPADAINAANGLLNTIADELGGYVWGLPVNDFHQALLWQYIMAPIERLPWSAIKAPSWTWAGWTRVAQLNVQQSAEGGWLGREDERRLAVVTYVFESKDGSVVIHSMGRGNIKQVSDEALPESIVPQYHEHFRLGKGTSLLCLYTAVAYLIVSTTPNEHVREEVRNDQEFPLLSSWKETIGYLRITESQRQALGSQKIMCIVLSYSERLYLLDKWLEGTIDLIHRNRWPLGEASKPPHPNLVMPFATIMGVVLVGGQLERLGIGQVSTWAFMDEQVEGAQWVIVA